MSRRNHNLGGRFGYVFFFLLGEGRGSPRRREGGGVGGGGVNTGRFGKIVFFLVMYS